MCITLDLPPALEREAEEYAKERGTTLNEMVMAYIRRTLDGKDAIRRFRSHVLEVTPARLRGEPYKFRRADAYDDSPSGARNYDFP